MIHRLQRLLLLFFVGYAAVALTMLYWGVWHSQFLLTREDNPRTVEAEWRVVRGDIVDRNGVVLAESVPVGTSGRVARRYPIPDVGAAVGYYSLRYGTSGVEQAYDALLRGQSSNTLANAWRQILNQPPHGRAVRLTLDAGWQQTAASLLGPQQGAILLISLPDGAIRVLISHPTFDPSQLNDRFEALSQDPAAPLLNRVTQAQYQPGLALYPFLLASAVDTRRVQLTDEVAQATAEVSFDGQTITCLAPPPDPATWAAVLRTSCPAPVLSLPLQAADLSQATAAFGFTTPPSTFALPLPLAPALTPAVADLRLALLGQDQLTVTPLQMGVALSMLVQDGQPAVPRLVSAVQNEGGEWESVAAPASSTANPAPLAVRPETAHAIRTTFAPSPDGRGAEYAALAWGGQTPHAWYLGFAPTTAPRFIVVVVLEEALGVLEAQAIGRALLATAVTQ